MDPCVRSEEGCFVEYEETYHGRRIIITTLQHAEGDWTSKAELLDSGGRLPVAGDDG